MAKGEKNPENNTGKKRGKNKYFILSIDGGGIRGVIPATVLAKLEEMIRAKRKDEGSIGDYFDFIAGTSTGGILTCLYLTPSKADPCKARFSADTVRNFYLDHGEEIFDLSLWQRLKAANGLLDEKYSARELEKHLRKYLGNVTMKELIKPCLVTGYDVRQYRPVFFTQQDAGNPSANYLIRDVARATAAAPTYFEAALPTSLDKIDNETPVIDGGVFANNPTACALVEVLRKGYGKGHGVKMEDIVILSLGTGRKPATITYKECKDWGLLGWARPLLGIMMEGESQTVDYQMQCIFECLNKKDQYLRIDGEFGDYKNNLAIEDLDPSMDCASKDNMEKLSTFGEILAQNNEKVLKEFVDRFF